MRPLYDDFDEFDFDDSHAVARLLREQRREATRRASRRSSGPKRHRYDDDDNFSDYGDRGGYGSDGGYENHREIGSYEYGDYDDYDEQEFDLYAGIGREH